MDMKKRLSGGRMEEVDFRNVPSYFARHELKGSTSAYGL